MEVCLISQATPRRKSLSFHISSRRKYHFPTCRFQRGVVTPDFLIVVEVPIQPGRSSLRKISTKYIDLAWLE
jgi:hypothetical protein